MAKHHNKVPQPAIRTLPLAATLIAALSPLNSTASEALQDSLALATALCTQPEETPTELNNHVLTEKEIIVRGSLLGTEKLFTSANNSFKLEIIEPAGRSRRTALTASTDADKIQKNIWMILDSDCNPIEAKRIVYDDSNTPLYIQTLDASFEPITDKDWLNPPMPKKGRKDGLRVALVDSGVNYQLDELANSLALNDNDELIGYDFWDNDNTPFDANPARSPFFVQRHGTRTASILLREAPNIALVPYRYPRPDMSRMAQLVAHAAKHDVRIIGMPLGSNSEAEWQAFSNAVKAHPEILFIVSAGNNGRDIDLNPVYPAALEHSNILVVTSANDFIEPADRTNYGKASVDYLLPAEEIIATDFNGEEIQVSGSSYAVSRLTAMAARLLMNDQSMSIDTLKTRISSHSVKASTMPYVSTGYIGDPIADIARLKSNIDRSFIPIDGSDNSDTSVTLNLVAVGSSWRSDQITGAVQTANTIFQQCGISFVADELIRVSASGYLENLSPGAALTISQHLNNQLTSNTATVFFAADTDMQIKFDAEAFGEGNTNSRPWMRNTLWVTAATPEPGHAVAHEIFHILTNSGQHSVEKNNLMQNSTSPRNTVLQPEQCQMAITTATENRLISSD